MRIIVLVVSSALASLEFPHSDEDDDEVVRRPVFRSVELSEPINETLVICRKCNRPITVGIDSTTSFASFNTIVHSACYTRSGPPCKEPGTPRVGGLRRVASLTQIET